MTTPAPAAPAPAAVPGKTLGIVGLILAFLAAPIGFIISLVAAVQSKKAGVPNTPATAGIIIGLILTIVWIVVIIVSVVAGAALLNLCAGLEPGIYPTPATAARSPADSDQRSSLTGERTGAADDVRPGSACPVERRDDGRRGYGCTTWTPSARPTRPGARSRCGSRSAPLAQGRTDPTMQRDATGIWITLATATGAASLHLRSAGGSIEATAWGPGAAAAIEQVPALCGDGDDDERLRRDPASADRRAAPSHAGAAAHAGGPHPAVPGAHDPRAEGHGHRAEARLAAARHPARRARARPGADRDARGAAARGVAPDPVVGVASRRRRTAALRHRHARGRRRATPSSGRAQWMPRMRSGACAPSPVSASGPRTRPCSARTAIRTR